MTTLSDLIARLEVARWDLAFAHGAFVVDGIGTESEWRQVDQKVKRLRERIASMKKAREARR